MTNLDIRFPAVAEALVARAKAHYAADELALSLSDLALSCLFAGRLVDDKLSEAVRDNLFKVLPASEQRYRGRRLPWKAALASAERGDNFQSIKAHLDDALFLAVSDSRGGRSVADNPRLYRDILAPILAGHGQAELGAGASEPARTYLALATLLMGAEAPPEWWTLRGEAHEAMGEWDAAFFCFSYARMLQGDPAGDELDEPLARTFKGTGSWSIASAAAAPALNALSVTSAPISSARQGTQAKSRVKSARSRIEDRWTARLPKEGSVFPDFAAKVPRLTGGGTLSTSALRGKALLVTFFTADCSSCIQRLPRMGSLARSLRRTNHDTVSIGVSLDDSEGAFDRVMRLGEHWGELVHAPELAEQFGVERVPVTLVVDLEGVTRLVLGPSGDLSKLPSTMRSFW